MITLLLVWLGIVIVLMYTRARIEQFDNTRPMVVATDDIEIALTRFVYLTQTENCLPTYLMSPKVIGDSELCQCNITILSYKKVQ